MNILFIEDHVLVRESLIYALKKLHDDIFVIEALNISESAQLIPNVKSLEMILLDIALPGTDGLTLCRTVINPAVGSGLIITVRFF